jgi:hypothetical protein
MYRSHALHTIADIARIRIAFHSLVSRVDRSNTRTRGRETPHRGYYKPGGGAIVIGLIETVR